jgi:tetratricopeptide (TPR) repeat protein
MIICRKTGQLAEAIRAGEEAVGPWRRVAAADHDYQASLAATLEDLSGCYARVGRWADARRTSAEAIVLYGRLVQGDPQRFALNLALNLANNSVQHEHLREYDSALVASQEAVSILRRRALADPASVEANLVDAAGDAD